MEITEEVGKDAEGENPEEMMESDDKQNEPESMFSLFLLLFIKIIRCLVHQKFLLFFLFFSLC